jgi:hypothetical protein
VISRTLEFVDRHWRWLAVLAWALMCAWLVYYRWGHISGFVLSDTDDNLRLAQVRAWLNDGQGWYDLRQYRLDWPDGANIHWTRFVDLPLAGLILIGRLFLAGPQAEVFAVAAAPLVPLLLLLFALALIVRRLVEPRAWPLVAVCLFFAGSAIGQFYPTRIDHHGWQLALLALGAAGIADPKKARGGATLGIAGAASLAIGMEAMIYIALGGAATVLSWIADPTERRRLAAYAASLGGGTALAFTVFASNDNRQAVCDALSQVWLSDALLGGALLVALAWWTPAKWQARLGAAAAAGMVLALFHYFAWPNCLTRLEGVSDEVYDLWLSNVREARPIYRHGWRIALAMVALPIAGIFGWALLAWRARGDPERLRRTLGVAALALAAALLLLWQSRTGPAAQLLAIPGSIALVIFLAPLLSRSPNIVVRTAGTAIVVLLALGALVPLAIDFVPNQQPANAQSRKVGKANASCPSLRAMRPIAELPPATIFTFADLTPRLIAVTHHRGIAGPYHRNGEAIADSMKLFRGSPEQARRLLDKYRADYLMTCPMLSQATVFQARAPNGFYMQLEKGRAPDWLEPVPLPEGSPLKLWRVKREVASGAGQAG